MNLEIVGHDGVCLSCDSKTISVIQRKGKVPIIKSLGMDPSTLLKYKFNQIKPLFDGKYLYKYDGVKYIIEKITSNNSNTIIYYIYGPKNMINCIKFIYNNITYTCTDIKIKQ